MANDLFEVQTQDYKVVQGDTLNLAWNFKDKQGDPILDIVNWDSRFSIEDFISHDIITGLVKTHNDAPPVGGGVYYNGDVNIVPGLGITADNQVVVVLTAADTDTLLPGTYKIYFKFIISQAYNADFTAVVGNLKVLKRDT
jgi:hypothetical protein